MCCTSITHGIAGSANAVVQIKHTTTKGNLMVSDLCIWHWCRRYLRLRVGGRDGGGGRGSRGVGHDYNTQ